MIIEILGILYAKFLAFDIVTIPATVTNRTSSNIAESTDMAFNNKTYVLETISDIIVTSCYTDFLASITNIHDEDVKVQFNITDQGDIFVQISLDDSFDSPLVQLSLENLLV